MIYNVHSSVVKHGVLIPVNNKQLILKIFLFMLRLFTIKSNGVHRGSGYRKKSFTTPFISKTFSKENLIIRLDVKRGVN